MCMYVHVCLSVLHSMGYSVIWLRSRVAQSDGRDSLPDARCLISLKRDILIISFILISFIAAIDN